MPSKGGRLFRNPENPLGQCQSRKTEAKAAELDRLDGEPAQRPSTAQPSLEQESGERKPAQWPSGAAIVCSLRPELGEREPAQWLSAAAIGPLRQPGSGEREPGLCPSAAASRPSLESEPGEREPVVAVARLPAAQLGPDSGECELAQRPPAEDDPLGQGKSRKTRRRHAGAQAKAAESERLNGEPPMWPATVQPSLEPDSGEREPAQWPSVAAIVPSLQPEPGEREPAQWPTAAAMGPSLQPGSGERESAQCPSAAAIRPSLQPESGEREPAQRLPAAQIWRFWEQLAPVPMPLVSIDSVKPRWRYQWPGGRELAQLQPESGEREPAQWLSAAAIRPTLQLESGGRGPAQWLTTISEDQPESGERELAQSPSVAAMKAAGQAAVAILEADLDADEAFLKAYLDGL